MKSNSTVWVLAALVSAAPGWASGEPSLVLARQGAAQATIVLGRGATAVETFAAAELQRYLQASSGAEFPISTVATGGAVACEIRLGTPASNEAIARLLAAGKLGRLTSEETGFDGFVMKRLIDNGREVVVLAGIQPRGALFAAYAFLEELGVRFYGFGKSGEIIPELLRVQIGGLDRAEKPQFKFRIATDNNFVATNRDMLVQVADWAVKNRFNTFLLRLDDAAHVATEELAKRGMEVWGSGHVWGQLTPDKSLFASHPEYFPLINGKRTFPGDKFAIAFCYSNPEAMKLFVDKAAAYVRQRPMLDVFACWPQDGSQHWAQCQCEGCRQHTFSEWSLMIMNHLAQRFETEPVLRRVRLQWIAYDEASPPPLKVVPYHRGTNIDLLYANGARDYLSPMDSPANRRCASWLLQDSARKQINTDFKPNPTDDDLGAYQRLTGMMQYLKSVRFEGNVSLLEYVNMHIGYWLDLPYLQDVQTGPWDDRVFPKDLLFYRAQGIAGWADCFDWLNDAPDPFWNWFMARLLWNPDAEVNRLKEDFYTYYYRAAGPVMRAYFEELWRLLNREPKPGDYERLKALAAQVEQGTKLADHPVTRDRVARVRDWHQSLRLAKPSSNLIADGSFESVSLEEGKSDSLAGSGGAWRITRPPSGALCQAVDGHNVLSASGKRCGLTLLSSNYVFEARTAYKLEVEIFPLVQHGTVALVASPRQGGAERLILTAKDLSGLKPRQWNPVVLEWCCRPGAAEENRAIGVFLDGFEGAAVDRLVLKAAARAEESNPLMLRAKTP